MPNKNSSKKYINDESDLDSHYYQNAHTMPPGHMVKTRLDDHRDLLNERIQSNGAQLASSSASSQRALIATHDSSSAISSKRLNKKYSFLILAATCLVASLITTAITFIFPFWLTLTVRTTLATNINVTNTNNHLTLLANNTAASSGDIKFYLGLWEVKMDRALVFYDPATPTKRYPNAYPQSMLWLNADANDVNSAFLLKLTQFIDLAMANLSVVQILEIVHLIFTFLAFCFTAFTLCLCESSAFCWHLLCLLFSLLSFLLGASVIGLLVYWDTFATSHVNLLDSQMKGASLIKDYNWCFWAAVGVNATLLLACILILVYVFVAVCIIYLKASQRRRLQQHKQQRAKSSSLGGSEASSELEGIRESRLPRLHQPR